MIRTNYDPEADVLHVRFGPADARYDGAESLSVILCARHNERQGAYYAEQIEESRP